MIQKRYCIAASVVLVAASAISFSAPVRAFDFQDCYKCHKEVLDDNMGKLYIHRPFLQQQCSVCHLPNGVSEEDGDTAASNGADDHGPASIERGKIQWIGESAAAEMNHWFLVPADRLNHTLYVEARDANGTPHLNRLAVPPLDELPAVEDDGKPPTISDVRVEEISKGLFLSATISWTTNEMADSSVLYGINDINQTSTSGDNSRISRRHQVTLFGLKPNTTYQYSVASTDLFGHQQLSSGHTFSTAKAIHRDTGEQAMLTGEKEPSPPVLDHEFYRIEGEYLIKVAADRPVTMFIGATEVPRKVRMARRNGNNPARDPQTDLAQKKEEGHKNLNNALATNNTVCDTCHKDYRDTLSHPVDVFPKQGMIIPAEYPTLPDGRISCMSCHSFHASDYEFRLIKSSKRELCIGCHRDMA